MEKALSTISILAVVLPQVVCVWRLWVNARDYGWATATLAHDGIPNLLLTHRTLAVVKKTRFWTVIWVGTLVASEIVAFVAWQ